MKKVPRWGSTTFKERAECRGKKFSLHFSLWRGYTRIRTHSRGGKIKIVIVIVTARIRRDATKERESAKGGQREDDRGA